MRFGLVDIGSNSVKCTIFEYDWQSKDLNLLLNRSITLGLISYVKDGVMQEAGIAALMRTVAEYQLLSQSVGGEFLSCVATASMRNLTNGNAICKRVKETLGCEIQIIPATEEARLGFLAAQHVIQANEKGVLIDMGGASTELTAFENGEVRHFISLPFGCLTLFMKHVSSVFPTKAERKEIGKQVELLLAEAEWLKEYGENLYLIGGTAKAIGKLMADRLKQPWQDGFSYSAEALDGFYRAYREPSKKKIRALIAVAPDRLHTILPGLLAYRKIMEFSHARRICVTFAGLREGLARAVIEAREAEK